MQPTALLKIILKARSVEVFMASDRLFPPSSPPENFHLSYPTQFFHSSSNVTFSQKPSADFFSVLKSFLLPHHILIPLLLYLTWNYK